MQTEEPANDYVLGMTFAEDELSTLSHAFGADFVSYVLNYPMHSANSQSLSTEQVAAIRVMLRYADNVLTTDENGELNENARADILAPDNFDTETPIGVARRLRLECGGQDPVDTTTDIVESLLLSYAQDIYPVVHMTGGQWLYHNLGSNERIVAHPTRVRLLQHVYADRPFRKLFSDNHEHPNDLITGEASVDAIWTHVVLRSGESGPVFLKHLPEALTGYAFLLAAMSNDMSLSAVLDGCRQALADARQLATEKEIYLPIVQTYSRLTLADGISEIHTAFGTLRPISDMARPFLWFLDLPGQSSNVESMLIGKYRQQILAKGRSAAEQHMDHLLPFGEYEEETTLLAERFLFSLILSVDGKSPGATPDFKMRMYPFESLIIAGRTDRPSRQDATTYEIMTEQVASLIEWSSRVAGGYPAALNIGIRRILAAAATRSDPLDGLIDSVIVWENLFGDKNDTTLKVCGSIVALLGPPDRNARESMMSRVKAIYTARSDIVHGANLPSSEQAVKDRDEALSLAIRAMRAVFQRPELLHINKSAQRSTEILVYRP